MRSVGIEPLQAISKLVSDCREAISSMSGVGLHALWSAFHREYPSETTLREIRALDMACCGRSDKYGVSSDRSYLLHSLRPKLYQYMALLTLGATQAAQRDSVSQFQEEVMQVRTSFFLAPTMTKRRQVIQSLPESDGVPIDSNPQSDCQVAAELAVLAHLTPAGKLGAVRSPFLFAAPRVERVDEATQVALSRLRSFLNYVQQHSNASLLSYTIYQHNIWAANENVGEQKNKNMQHANNR